MFNDTVRFVFVAGLEGSGHHGLTSFFKGCPIIAPLSDTRCEQNGGRFAVCDEVVSGLFTHRIYNQNTFRTNAEIDRDRNLLVLAFKERARTLHTNGGSSTGKLVAINTYIAREMSYPVGKGHTKVRNILLVIDGEHRRRGSTLFWERFAITPPPAHPPARLLAASTHLFERIDFHQLS